MDATKEQQDVTDAQALVDSLTKQLADAQTALQTAQGALDNVSNINWLESLTPDEVTARNADLGNDPDNKTGITLALPPATT